MKKNNSKLKAAAAVVLAALLLIAVNLCVSKLSEKLGLRLDMTGNKLYELSDETLNVLGELDMPVDIKVFSAEEDFTPLVAEVLRRYEQAGDGLTVEYIDPYTKPTVVDEYIQKGLEINLNTVVVESGSYACAIDLEDMFVLDSSGQNVQQLNCEQLLTSAVLRAEGARSRSAVFIAGHNEYVSDTLRELFTQNNYSVSDISLSLKDIAAGTDLAVIAAPSSDFSSEEVAKLDAYMASGGRLLVFAEPSSGEFANLDAFLHEWGIGLSSIVVAEKTQFTDANPLSIVPIYSGHEINSYFSANQLYLVMPSTVALEQEFVSRGSIKHDCAVNTLFRKCTSDVVCIVDISMEIVGVCCTSATAIEFCKTVTAFFFRINIAALKFITDILTFDTLVHISKQEILISNKLMTRIKVTPRCHCQILCS